MTILFQGTICNNVRFPRDRAIRGVISRGERQDFPLHSRPGRDVTLIDLTPTGENGLGVYTSYPDEIEIMVDGALQPNRYTKVIGEGHTVMASCGRRSIEAQWMP